MKKQAFWMAAVLAGAILLPRAWADNQASFDQMDLTHYKRMKGQMDEDFLKKYGTPDQTLSDKKNGKTVETYTYNYSECRYRFSFADHVFSQGSRICF